MKSDGAIHVPSTPTHRWSVSPAHWRARAARPYDAAAREFFWNLRWRRKAPQRAKVALGLAGVVVLHVLAFALLRQGSVPDFPVAADEHATQAIQARLIEPPPAPTVVPVQLLPATQANLPKAHKPVRAPQPVATPEKAMTATLETTPMSTPPAKVYDRLGNIVLPDTPAPATSASAADYHAPAPQGSEKLMHPHQVMTYTPTKLEKRFLPAAETPLTKAVRKTTGEHTFNLPFGIHIRCVISPLSLAGGCAPVAPEELSAPLVVQHKRDNLAPATPLIRKPDKPAESATATLPAQ